MNNSTSISNSLFLIYFLTIYFILFPGGSDGKASAYNAGVQSLGQDDLLEKEMATHSSILAWKIPWMEEPGRLLSTGSQSWTRLSDFTLFYFGCSEFLSLFRLFSSFGEWRLLFDAVFRLLTALASLVEHSNCVTQA